MSEEQARARVEAFVADFYARWQRSGRMPADFSSHPSFEAWAGELEQLVRSHGTAEFRTGVEGSFSSHPAHEPGAERITDVRVEAGWTVVRTELTSSALPTYYEYRLVRVDDELRIDELISFLDPPGALLVDADEAERLLARATPDAVLAVISPQLQLDLPSLFAEGREVTHDGEPAPIEVHRLGEITLASGVVAVRDLGYGAHALEPLARQVLPGTYPVEVSRADHTNIALRMRLTEAPAIAWFRADRTGGGNVVGVDYANVSITDLASLVTCEAQHVEELYDRHVTGLVHTPGVVFALQGEVADGVVAMSGYGDGGYPCYWGLSADGQLAELVVDFLVLVESLSHAVTVPWQLGRLEAPGLVEHAFEIEDRGDVFVLSHGEGPVDRVQVMVPGGRVYMDTERLGVMVSGGRRSYWWPALSRPPAEAVVTVKIGDGYRHI